MARGLLLKAALALAVIAMCAGLWAEVPRLSDPLAPDIDAALAVRAPAGGSPYLGCGSWHDGPDCWSDAARGSGLALLIIFSAGIPVSIAGVGLASRVRRSGVAMSDAWKPIAHTATVFQAGTAALAGVLLVLHAWDGGTSWIVADGPMPVTLLAANLVCGALALPAWRGMASR